MIQNKSKLSVVESAWEAWRNREPSRPTLESMRAQGWLPRTELAKEVGRAADKLTPAWGEKEGLETTSERVLTEGVVTLVRFFRPKACTPTAH
jgi:nuclear transport factor 2 (NTF2) superfamily protein